MHGISKRTPIVWPKVFFQQGSKCKHTEEYGNIANYSFSTLLLLKSYVEVVVFAVAVS